MNLSNLTQEQQSNIRFVLEWVNRMSERFGSTIQDMSGNEYDWGQALCRECYGDHWDDFMKKHNVTMPGAEAVEIAKRWEDGEIPEWALYGDIPPSKTELIALKEDIRHRFGQTAFSFNFHRGQIRGNDPRSTEMLTTDVLVTNTTGSPIVANQYWFAYPLHA